MQPVRETIIRRPIRTLSDNSLFDVFLDNKINGRISGQKGQSMALIGYARVPTAEQNTAL